MPKLKAQLARAILSTFSHLVELTFSFSVWGPRKSPVWGTFDPIFPRGVPSAVWIPATSNSPANFGLFCLGGRKCPVPNKATSFDSGEVTFVVLFKVVKKLKQGNVKWVGADASGNQRPGPGPSFPPMI